MGISTDLMQQMNRTFSSQKAEKNYIRKQKEDFEKYLYNRFYKKFYEEKDFDPQITYSYFIDIDKKSEILQDFKELDILMKNNLYNKVLNIVYKDFKNDYNTNKSTSNIEKEEAKQQKKLEKALREYEKAIKERDKAKMHYQKALVSCGQATNKIRKETKKGLLKIGIGLFVGGRIANKTYKRMKY